MPIYKTIKVLNDELSTNTATIPTTLGGGQLGHVAIIVSPAIYATLSNTPFVAPTSPNAPNLAGLTDPQISAANQAYNKALQIFQD